jgi:hypothetical protein
LRGWLPISQRVTEGKRAECGNLKEAASLGDEEHVLNPKKASQNACFGDPGRAYEKL